MVNTFIIRKDTKKVSYRETAQLLDRPRLNKQIHEAKQMINSIEGAFEISKRLNIPIPRQCKNNISRKNMERFLANAEWIKKVYQAYKNHKETLIYRENKYEWVKGSGPMVVWKTQKCIENGDTVKIGDKTFDRTEVCLTKYGERVYSKNNIFVYHACVKMWVGYLDAFRYYFNCMVQVARERGIKIMYDLYEIEKLPVVKPWWTEHSSSIFMASLLRKELMRNEKVWYDLHFPEIRKTRYFDRGYVWFANLSIESIMEIHRNGIQDDHFSPKQKMETIKKRKSFTGLIKVDKWVDVEFDP